MQQAPTNGPLPALWIYTVTFLDPSLGVWKGTERESTSVQATPGGTVVVSFIFNSHEGPVRIQETFGLVIGPDRTVRVERTTFGVVGCT